MTKVGTSSGIVIALGKGKFPDEMIGFSSVTGPKIEFIEIAQATDAEITSYSSASARRGRWFKAIFERTPLVGCAFDLFLRAGRYKVCYFTGEDVGFVFAILCRLRFWQGKIICIVHNMTKKKEILIRFLGHKNFLAFIVVSQMQKNIIVSSCKIPESKVLHYFNWVDTDFLTKAAENEAAANIVMACGAENRDYETLMAAAPKVRAKIQIFGHGFFGQQKGTDEICPSNVRAMPRVNFTALKASYQQCDLVVMPLKSSVYASGVTGLVEAMACSKAVVVTRSPGISEYVAHLDDCCLVSPGDSDEMAFAINNLLEAGSERREDIGNRNRSWVREHCDLEKYVASIKELISSETV